MIATDLSADARAVADALNGTPLGETIDYPTISASIGRDITTYRWVLTTAFRVAERETGAVFALIRRVGYRRLLSDEISKVGQTARASIRAKATRSVRTMSAGIAQANDISDNARQNILREQTALGLISHLARDRNMPATPAGATHPAPVGIAVRAVLQHLGAVT